MLEYTLDDGRKAERVEKELDNRTKVVEVYVEPKVEKKLSQRITERYCVCEREIETIDENTGEVVDRKIEKVNGESVYVEKAAVPCSKSIKSLVEEKIKQDNKLNLNMVYLGVIVAQVAALAYVLFFM